MIERDIIYSDEGVTVKINLFTELTEQSFVQYSDMLKQIPDKILYKELKDRNLMFDMHSIEDEQKMELIKQYFKKYSYEELERRLR